MGGETHQKKLLVLKTPFDWTNMPEWGFLFRLSMASVIGLLKEVIPWPLKALNESSPLS